MLPWTISKGKGWGGKRGTAPPRAGGTNRLHVTDDAGGEGIRHPPFASNPTRGGVTVEDARIDILYRLLEEAVKKGDTEGAAALRWAIFQLENM